MTAHGIAAALCALTALSTGRLAGQASIAPKQGVGFYAAPHGSAAGDGSRTRPWDLTTALTGGHGRVQPGDTVWLRGGSYRGPFHSTLTGTAAAPIVVRQYPGERAMVDGAGSLNDTFVVQGPYSIFWGFEVVNTDPTRCCSTSSNFRADMVTNYAPHTKFVNLIVHDGGPGFFVATTYPDVEIYGCIVYNIGYQGPDRGHGHAMYIKSDSGPIVVRDNVMFNQFGFGVHQYTDAGHGHLNNIRVEGNVIFNSGLLSNNSQSANILAGGGQEPADGIAVVDNMTYYPPGYGAKNVQVGPVSSLLNGTMIATGNYAVGGSPTLYVGYWQAATATGNSVFSGGTVLQQDAPRVARHQWGGNTYYRSPGVTAWGYAGSSYTFNGWQAKTGLGSTDQATAALPTVTKVFVRPNVYEPGRANIVIYNWSQVATVPVDVSKVLRPGDRYAVRNVQALFGAPVASGTYAGGTIALPMAGVKPPVPIGVASSPAPVTGPAFDVFLLTRAAGSGSKK